MALLEFDGGLEIRVHGYNKASALGIILGEMGAEAPIACLGDDSTDEQAFRCLGERGLSVLVRPEWRETKASVWLKPPEELLSFLTLWLIACRGARQKSSARQSNGASRQSDGDRKTPP
jgi:trehalose-6-phosphatase